MPKGVVQQQLTWGRLDPATSHESPRLPAWCLVLGSAWASFSLGYLTGSPARHNSELSAMPAVSVNCPSTFGSTCCTRCSTESGSRALGPKALSRGTRWGRTLLAAGSAHRTTSCPTLTDSYQAGPAGASLAKCLIPDLPVGSGVCLAGVLRHF